MGEQGRERRALTGGFLPNAPYPPVLFPLGEEGHPPSDEVSVSKKVGGEPVPGGPARRRLLVSLARLLMNPSLAMRRVDGGATPAREARGMYRAQ